MKSMKTRILLVEDNPATAEVIEHHLQFLGYDVLIAGNGFDAVKMAESELPDLILMDITLPKIDGLQATSRIRANPKTKAIPILATTARALPGDREECLKAGCSGYLVKPFTRHELNAQIVGLLKEKAAATEPAQRPVKEGR